MRLSRSQSLVIAVGLLVIFFAAGISLARSSRPAPSPEDLAKQQALLQSFATPTASNQLGPAAATSVSSTPSSKQDPQVEANSIMNQNTTLIPGQSETPQNPNNSLFALKQFHRSEMKDGRKVWEVTATQGEYFPAESAARVKDAHVLLYRKGGEVVQIDTKEALLHLQAGTLSRAETSGGVKIVYNDKLTITTEVANFDREKNIVFAPGLVEIRGEMMDISGNVLNADVEKKEMTLSENVVSVIHGRP